jgi:hypothetical protein
VSRPSREPLPLPPEMSTLLAAERRAPPPSAARQARILSRVQAAVAASGAATASAIATTTAAAAVKGTPVVGGALAGVAGVGGAAATATLTKPLLVLALVASTAGAIGGGMAVREHRRAKVQGATVGVTASRATAVVSPAPRSGSAGPNTGAPLSPPAAVPPPTVAASRTGSAVASPPKPPSRVGSVSSADIEAEAAVLERARLSLRAGDSAAALAAVQLHARRFPNGVLNEEREVLWIRALLRSGERAQGQRRAAAFVHRYPDSVHADSVARALREIP